MGRTEVGNVKPGSLPPSRVLCDTRIETLRDTFQQTTHQADAGSIALAARTAAVDELLLTLWASVLPPGPLSSSLTLLAVGGYGRRELFPYSDIDLLFLYDTPILESSLKAPIRQLNQLLWDSGLRVSPITRKLAECERFNPENVEFTLSLLDARYLAGDPALIDHLLERSLPKLIARDHAKITARLLEVTRARHAKYGNTLFHLEPNVKDCPGALRDTHVCAWLSHLGRNSPSLATPPSAFQEAREFIVLTRVFLHLRHGRDGNTLDWQAQDEAASLQLGTSESTAGKHRVDASRWMRSYFRHARSIERQLTQSIDAYAEVASEAPKSLLRLPSLKSRVSASSAHHPAFRIVHHRISFAETSNTVNFANDPANDPDVALAIFTAVARTGVRLSPEAEARLEIALPLLSAHLEDGPNLWRNLSAILTGPFAGLALRSMHALGILELLLPEFHGIDALVIRDAYHRYTVDEHTFVLIDTLHALALSGPKDPLPSGLALWSLRFAAILRELQNPALLFLAALLHDTGKAHSTVAHAAESVRMAESVLQRLELDPYEGTLVLGLIRNHLEMSFALRRDVFNPETVRAFAAFVPSPEALRMLTLLTYADISAVHPGALTPWKAEDLWRLHIAASHFLDHSVDDERVGSLPENDHAEILHRLDALLGGRRSEVAHFLEGLPRRYLHTRTPEQIRDHYEMVARLLSASLPAEVSLLYAPGVSELTLVTHDRPMLFASVAGALAAWGMNIITADAFSNAHGIVVDSFRFIDTFRTLELNQSERTRFNESMQLVAAGSVHVETLLSTRRRGRTPAPKVSIEARIHFDDSASTHSTLTEVVALDTPGLLRTLALTIAAYGCNIEVALVDTEGEMAIDVFYLTRARSKLDEPTQHDLRRSLLEAIAQNQTAASASPLPHLSAG